MKKILLYLCAVLLSVSCNRIEQQNEEYIRFYQSQPHDENLYGWWKVIDEDYYRYFDSENFNYLFASRKTDGSLFIQGYDEYWYSSDAYIYIFKSGSFKVGMEQYQYKYYLSDDHQIMYRIDNSDEPYAWLQRSEAPLQKSREN